MGTEHFERLLTWRDGFALALVIPLAIFATVTPSIAAIGSLGVILIFMGLLAELIIRTYHESQSKPVYLVQERRNFEEPASLS